MANLKRKTFIVSNKRTKRKDYVENSAKGEGSTFIAMGFRLDMAVDIVNKEEQILSFTMQFRFPFTNLQCRTADGCGATIFL